MPASMNWIAQTLWDLIAPPPRQNGKNGTAAPARKRPDRRLRPAADRTAPRAAMPSAVNGSMRDRYDALVAAMKRTYGIRVRRWRSSSSGCAWEVHYADGTTARLIEAPYPRGPVSCAIFLHEVGHHAIGFKTYRLRCLEEFHAWRFALDQMEARGFLISAAVERRVRESLRYAVAKARRRGLREIPPELLAYLRAR